MEIKEEIIKEFNEKEMKKYYNLYWNHLNENGVKLTKSNIKENTALHTKYLDILIELLEKTGYFTNEI